MDFFDPTNPIIKIILAILLGMFLGIRRERISKNVDFLGIRTLSVIGLLGCVSTLLPEIPILPIVMFGGLIVFVIIAYLYGVKIGRIGLTSEMSVFVVFLTGVLIGYNQFLLAIIITVLLAGLLAFKHELHNFANNITKKEWTGALQLLVIAGVILPFLPKIPIDPWGIFNPFSVWLFVVFITGIGFVGYFLMKYLGQKDGILLDSIVGSLVSSTAVSASLSAEARSGKMINLLQSGILLAIGVMNIRILIELLIFGTREIYIYALIPLVMSLSLAIFVIAGLKREKDVVEESVIKVGNPFRILPALSFAGLFVVILFIVHFAKLWFGDNGLYIVSIISSLVDTDMIILSNLEAFKGGFLSSHVISNVIFIAVVGNTLVKILYAWILGSFAFARKLILPILASSMLGAFTLYVINLFLV